MFDTKKILALIGARQHSRGLPDKNITDFSGKPLIAWTIESALGSKYVDRTIVSTDGLKISDIAKKAGADVPFLRPSDLASDDAQIYGAIHHCLDWLKNNDNLEYDILLWLQPTSPLRSTAHIDRAVEQYFRMRQSELDTMVSVCKAPLKMGRLMKEKGSGYIEFCFDMSKTNAQRQNLPTYYLPNGAIYIASTELIRHKSFYSGQTLFYEMSESESVDIDTPEDYMRALRVVRPIV